KPTPEGYKIVSLCDTGYTWTFTFTSRIEKNKEIEQITGLTDTGCLVWHLVHQLPKTKSYDVYMDNYFSSIALFKYMCDNAYGACGTVCLNSAKFPAELKLGKLKYQHLDWNTLLGKVVENVLAILWIDNGPVTMLTTIHNIGEEWTVTCERCRPRETSSNANTVCRVFGNLSRKALEIPKIIDDYNHYMGSVDIADQLRGYYNCQLTVRRTWFPLFFWLLDTTLVNCFKLYCKATDQKVASKEFRLDLAWDLINSTVEDVGKRITRSDLSNTRDTYLSLSKKFQDIYITETYNLPATHLIPGGHFMEWRETRKSCVYCRYLSKQGKIEIDHKNPPQTQLWCI